MRSSMVARRLFAPLCFVCLSGILVGVKAAEDPEAVNARIVPFQAVKSGRAPPLDILVQRLTPGTGAPEARGEINPLRRPPFLSPRPSAARGGESGAVLSDSFPVTANAPAAIVNIEGYSNADNSALFGFRITPPDTNGDVGLNHFVQYVNVGWIFFDKDGSPAGGPFPGNIFWQDFGGVCETDNAGDPIVLYDHLAGRWLFSQFTSSDNPDGHQCIAISDGEDPAGPYTLYDFLISPGEFNDYPKFGLWPDGYYMTTHQFAGSPLQFQGVYLTVFDRQALLSGTGSGLQFTNTDIYFGALPGNLEGSNLPPPGSCNYLVHATDTQAFDSSPTTDRYQFWKACMDFDNDMGTLTHLPSVNSPPFDVNLCNYNRNCIQQNSASGQKLDALAGFTIYRFNQRYFPAAGVLKSAVTNNIDVGGDRAGVMWAGFDINPANDAIAVGDGGDLLGVIDFQDNLSRWMGSASVDSDGNIGIGYTRAGPGSFPSVYFTVHERNVDGPGAVQSESSCIDGTGSHEGANRWADYASMSVDPADQCTFWHTNEYVETTGSFQWNTAHMQLQSGELRSERD